MAAQAAGLTEVILPERNEPDLDDLPSDVREQMRFYPYGPSTKCWSWPWSPLRL